MNSTFGGVLAIGLAVAGFGIWSLVWRQIVETGIRVCVWMVFSGWRPGLRLRVGAIGEALRYASVVLGSWIVQGLMHRADVFIIGSVLGVKALGFYAAALRIAQMVDDLVNAVAWQVSFPTFSRIVGNKPLLDSTYETLFKVTSWLQAPAIAILAGVAALLVPLLFGPQWNLSGPVLMWLLLLPLVGTMTQLNACLLFASNNAGRGFWLMVVGLVGTVIGSAIGSQISLEAAAIGTASRVLLIAPLGLWFIRPIVGLPAGRFGRLAGIAVGLSGAAFLGAAFGSSAIVPGVVARIAVGCSLGAALVLGTFWLLARADFTRGLGLLAVTAGRMLRRRES
jgi:PST family polysaccharide transporter